MAENVEELVRAVALRDVNKVKELIAAGVPVNEPDSSGDFPLIDAAQRGSTELVKLLLQAGANVNIGSKRSPLIKAAEEGHAETVAVLLAAGANVNQEGKHITPLAAAVSDRTKAHERIAKTLLAAGADVNYGQFTTVLMRASQNSTPEVVKALL